jgi:Cu(I)/Ag(I) efflux system membrane protein CusA/SilA
VAAAAFIPEGRKVKFPKLLLAPIVIASGVAHAALPTVDGEVRKVDADKGTIVLRHNEIPNLGMPAMAMQFHADGKLLRAVKPGDKVRFQADMVQGKATVVDLRVVK